MFPPPPPRRTGDQLLLSEEDWYVIPVLSIQKISGTFRHDTPILALFLNYIIIMNDKFSINMDGRYDQRKLKLTGQSVSVSHRSFIITCLWKIYEQNIKNLLIWTSFVLQKVGGMFVHGIPPSPKSGGDISPPSPPGSTPVVSYSEGVDHCWSIIMNWI